MTIIITYICKELHAGGFLFFSFLGKKIIRGEKGERCPKGEIQPVC